MTDELSRRRIRPRQSKAVRPFGVLLAEGVVWPFQTALTFPAAPPAMPKMIPSRGVTRDISFESKKMLRDVRCESVNERRFFTRLDAVPEVLWYQEQAPKVVYEMYGEKHDYYPDAVVALRNGHVFVVEVKVSRDFALYETICKVNALAVAAHKLGRGVFLGNQSRTVADFLHRDVRRALTRAVVTASEDPSGMSAESWSAIRHWFRRRHAVTSSCLQSIVLSERLVMTERPFNVRRAGAAEEKEVEAFVRRFESVAPILPLSAPAAPRPSGIASTGTGRGDDVSHIRPRYGA